VRPIDLGLGHLRLDGAAGPAEALVGEYGPAQGVDALRDAVAEWERTPREGVAVTTGASLGLAATLATLPRGARLLCPRPYYPAYPRLAEAFGLEVAFYPLRAEDGWRPDPDEIARLLRRPAAAVLWNAPANPTGAVCDAARMEAIGETFTRHPDLLLISDEVYAHFVYDGSPAALHPRHARTVRVRSFSKVFGLAGERVGYVLAEPGEADAISRAHWMLAMSPPATGQLRALAALRSDPGPRLAALVSRLCAQRDAAAAILRRCARVSFASPPAGFFHWLRVGGGARDDALAERCATRGGVHVLAGTAFGAADGAYLRASFAVPPAELTEGFERLAAFLEADASPPGPRR